jgi:hypothetical protein
VIKTDSHYNTYKIEDDEQKKHHLRMFRPNLENPANKEDTAKLNQRETKRTEDMKDVSIYNIFTLIIAY